MEVALKISVCEFYKLLWLSMWSFFSRDFSKNFPYEIDEQSEYRDIISCWSLFKAKKKGSSDYVSVFLFDVKNRTDAEFHCAKQSLKRLKTIRHPTILTYLDSYEKENNMYLVTECVQPLSHYLNRLNLSSSQKELVLLLGIYQITKAVSFLCNDAKLQHNNINIWSIFVNQSEDWKLAGFEYLHSQNEQLNFKRNSQLTIYNPPEGFAVQNCASDIWGLACLIWEVFNGKLSISSSLKNLGTIPEKLALVYRSMINTNTTKRPNAKDIIEHGRKSESYFDNILINTIEFLDEIQITDKHERNRFFERLNDYLDKFPESLCQNKILPKLIYAYEYGEAGPNVLTPLFKISRTLNEISFQKIVLPCFVKLFNSNDRTTRSKLLTQLEFFINYFPNTVINEEIFPRVVYGFLDSNLIIKEQTIKAIVYLAPKLNSHNLNVELLKYFAMLQLRDENGGIRTNVTVCLGKIAEHLDPKSRQKILISAFLRALRDPFPATRNSGVIAFATTQQYYLLSDIAQRILPTLSQLTIDPDKTVRDSVFRTIKGFLNKLEKYSEDPSLNANAELNQDNTSNLANTASNWTGWAMNAVTSKFYRSTNADVFKIDRDLKPKQSNSISENSQSYNAQSNNIEYSKKDTIPTATIKKLVENEIDTEEELIQWDTDDWGDMEDSLNTKTGANMQQIKRTEPIDHHVANSKSDEWNFEW